MTRTGRAVVASLIAIVLEFSLFGWNFGGRVSLVLVVLLVSALLLETKDAVLLGGISGLLMDLLGGRLLGMHVVTYALLCFFISRLLTHFFRERMFLVVCIGLGGTLLYYGLSSLWLFVFAPHYLPGLWFLSNVALSTVANGVLTVLIYPLVYRLYSCGGSGFWGKAS
ncbi:MAG TPA: rod shape-determining protein MreD [Firmicutes bacterium]|nr:rod shape-determining protein MreD [Bacillota bacterium]